jgi:hypothetical protein
MGNCLCCTCKDDIPFIDLFSADIKWQLKMGFLLRQARAHTHTHKRTRARARREIKIYFFENFMFG